jgi:uroporphyrinogen decarboxylase
MTKYERINAALAGEPVDRYPYSFWYHFTDIPVEERAGSKLAEAELAFYRKYDPDFLKVMHDVPYDLPNGKTRIDTIAEWQALPVLDPDEGNFARQQEALYQILDEIGEEAPVVDTVFNCFAYAEKITGKRTMELYRQDPEAFRVGMGKIAESLANWAESIIEQGTAGIYLAIQGASADVMTEAQYRQDFLPFDRLILERVHDLGIFNVAHLHGERLHWGVWDCLPFHALSWSSNITPPTIAEARKSFDGCIVAGVNEVAIGGYTPEQVKQEVREAIQEAGGHGLIVASGCAVPTDCPPANLQAFREAVG